MNLQHSTRIVAPLLIWHAPKKALAHIVRARERDEFIDFVLVCGPERFPVHRVIVCSQSNVFHAACSKPFKVNSHSNLLQIYMTNAVAGGGIGGV